MTRISQCIRWVAGLMAVLLLCGGIPVCLPAEAAEVAVPVEVVGKNGTVLSVVEYNSVIGMYLPGYINRKSVTLRYTGKTQLTGPDGKTTLAPGATGVFDLTADTVTVKEKSAVAGGSPVVYTVRVMGGSDTVPSLYISLDKDYSLSWLHENKEHKGSGRLTMLSGKGKEIYNGGLDTIKGRGNTSFTQPGLAPEKKSYSIKLENKAELIEGAGKMKKWALIHMRVCDSFQESGKSGYDWTGLCNLLGYQTYAALVGDGYADVKAQFVDLYIDGSYRGAYILTERLAVNAAVDIYDPEEFVTSATKDYEVCFDFNDPAMKAGVQYFQYITDAVKKQTLDITGGYLLEVNTPKLEEPCGFQTERGMHIDIKAPEVCTKEQVSYIARYFQLFEDALYSETGYNDEGKHYTDYVDMNSLASLVLTCAFYKNWELFRTSTYMYLDTANSDHPKLTFGPAWDFETGAQRFLVDSTFYSTHQLYTDTESQCYMILGQLTTKGDFQQLMYEKNLELKKIINATVGSGKYEGITHANTLWRNALESLNMNWARWNFERILDQKGGTYKDHKNNYEHYAKTFVQALSTRKDAWDKLWNTKEYLMGVTVERSKVSLGAPTLTAKVTGTADGYQWYRLTDTNKLEKLDEEERKSLRITETGTYLCVAYGGNNAYYGGSLSDILSNETVYMTSNPLYVEVDAKATTGTTALAPGATGGNTGDSTTGPAGSTTVDGADATTAPSAGESTAAGNSKPTTSTTTPAGSGDTAPSDTPDTPSDPQGQPEPKPPATVPPVYRVLLSLICGVACWLLVWWGDSYNLVYCMYRMMKTQRKA